MLAASARKAMVAGRQRGESLSSRMSASSVRSRKQVVPSGPPRSMSRLEPVSESRVLNGTSRKSFKRSRADREEQHRQRRMTSNGNMTAGAASGESVDMNEGNQGNTAAAMRKKSKKSAMKSKFLTRGHKRSPAKESEAEA